MLIKDSEDGRLESPPRFRGCKGVLVSPLGENVIQIDVAQATYSLLPFPFSYPTTLIP